MDSFKKRQRERQRLDKQREKAERRIGRKLHPLGETEDSAPPEAIGAPPGGAATTEPTVTG
jgi:hypothetical protein